MKVFFAEIKEKIQRRNELLPWQRLKLGKERESMVESALQKLKDECLIKDFLPTKNLSWADVIKGVDFFIVYVSKKYRKYRICRLNVTGRGWVELKKRQHPENQIIFVDLGETQESIKNKILRAIAAQENWKH